MEPIVEVINNGNHILIDRQFENFVLAAKRTCVFEQVPGVSLSYFGSVSYVGKSGSTPIAAVSVEGASFAVPSGVEVSGNSYTWYFDSASSGISTRPPPLEVFIFDASGVVSTASGLLVVYDDDGRVVFDSDNKYMRVEQALPIPFHTTTTVQTQNSASKKLAVVYASLAFYQREGVTAGLTPYWWWNTETASMVARRNTQGVVFKYELTYSRMMESFVPSQEPPPIPQPDISVTPGFAIVIDVTGY